MDATPRRVAAARVTASWAGPDSIRALLLLLAAVGLEAGTRAAILFGFHKSGFPGYLDLVLTPLLLVAAFVFALRGIRTPGRRATVIALCGTVVTLIAVAAVVPVRSLPPSPWILIVHKSKHELILARGGHVVRRCRVALAPRVSGAKECEGDLRTPEGIFYVCDKVPGVFHKWLGLSYPGSDDGLRGLTGGHLVWAEYWLVRVKNVNRRIPPQGTWLGGNIGIHGGGARRDWTLGCIALENSDVDAVYDMVPVGTTVEVTP